VILGLAGVFLLIMWWSASPPKGLSERPLESGPESDRDTVTALPPPLLPAARAPRRATADFEYVPGIELSSIGDPSLDADFEGHVIDGREVVDIGEPLDADADGVTYGGPDLVDFGNDIDADQVYAKEPRAVVDIGDPLDADAPRALWNGQEVLDLGDPGRDPETNVD
jgi:hypothetical protein